MTLDDASLELLRPYVSNTDRRVFALQGLPEEVIAVLFAYYSRSRDDLRTNLARLLTDQSLGVVAQKAAGPAALRSAQHKASAFHQKWVVGYGHASVAEHAVVHLALENVSILASKVIEDLRLGSYTEKSTRYVLFDTASFADLPSLPAPLGALYRSTCQSLFQGYLDLFPQVQQKVRATLTERDQAAPSDAALRSHSCDLLRGLLPASTLTNLGLTANARALSGLLSKMLSSPLAEARQLAEEMQTEALEVVPTLLRHVRSSEHRAQRIALSSPDAQSAGPLSARAESPVRVVRFDSDALERVALALVYDGSVPGTEDLVQQLSQSSTAQLEQLVHAALCKRGPYDAVPRGFEASSITVELELDYGAYRDLQRHRLLTPCTQLLTCRLGPWVSEELKDFGLQEQVLELLTQAQKSWTSLYEFSPIDAQYVVPLAYRTRTLWTLNLRELFHVVELRSGRQGHASYRRLAQALYGAVCEKLPWLRPLIRADLSSYRLARSG